MDDESAYAAAAAQLERAGLQPRERLVLFDGVCNLCNRSVQWIIRHDPHEKFKFAALQADISRVLLTGFERQKKHKEVDNASIVLIMHNKVYRRSSAIIRIAVALDGASKLLVIFWIIPKFIRDALYNWLASHRYGWFGRMDICMRPTPELRRRFLL